MTVTRQQLEAHLDIVRARVRDPRAGLFGPGSMLWRINREQLSFLAGGRAALLQEAHPYVAQGVDDHSLTRTDPLGRFERTFQHVHAMLFGDLDSALASARRVHAIHTRIQGELSERSAGYPAGSKYEANAEHALLWVHATLWESSVKVYELLFRPLSAEEKERYYQETKLFAYMFGISDATLPPTWHDFLAYNERMWLSDELAVGDVARSMSRFLLAPAKPSLKGTMKWYRIITAGLLPPRLRDGYRFAYGAQERAIFEASIRGLRVSARLLPRKYRFVPAYIKARSRIGQPIVPTLPERIVLQAARASRGRPALRRSSQPPQAA